MTEANVWLNRVMSQYVVRILSPLSYLRPIISILCIPELYLHNLLSLYFYLLYILYNVYSRDNISPLIYLISVNLLSPQCVINFYWFTLQKQQCVPSNTRPPTFCTRSSHVCFSHSLSRWVLSLSHGDDTNNIFTSPLQVLPSKLYQGSAQRWEFF